MRANRRADFRLVLLPSVTYCSGMTASYVFDLDGTLVDTAPDLCFAINRIVEPDGRREIMPDEIPFMVGNGVLKLIERAYIRTGAALDDEALEKRYHAFLSVYEAHQTDRSRPYPGVVETLGLLKDQGARMAVLTNKPHQVAQRLVADLDLDRFFDVVVGGGDPALLKPNPSIFNKVIADLGGAGRAVMIGDSRPDIETARNAGAASVLVTYGYSAEPPDALGADAVVDRFTDVPAAVVDLIKQT